MSIRSPVATSQTRVRQCGPRLHHLHYLGISPCIRFGLPAETNVITTRLAANRRLLCASPKYIAIFGVPETHRDLARHNCISIRQGDEVDGLWRLTSGQGSNKSAEAVKVRGNLSTNDSEIAVNWTLDGHGIVMRAEWDIRRYLNSGRLVTSENPATVQNTRC